MMEMRHAGVFRAISQSKEISKETEETLHRVAKEFLEKFKRTLK